MSIDYTDRAASAQRQVTAPILDSTITCPQCAATTTTRMPTDACLFFWDCPACGALLKPEAGDCCVFCSWGSVPCPPVQIDRGCCG
ncbi:MAG: GDCCVxC domain-containing (seleno)protein [Rhodanobacteraceae bacterium]